MNWAHAIYSRPELLPYGGKRGSCYFSFGFEAPSSPTVNLQLQKLIGGLVLPDSNLYHMAFHLTRVLDWYRHGPLKQWVQVEQILAGIPLESVPWCQTDLSRWVLDHPTVGETWWACSKASQGIFCCSEFLAIYHHSW